MVRITCIVYYTDELGRVLMIRGYYNEQIQNGKGVIN